MQSKDAQYRRMTQEAIPKLLLSLSVPTMLTMLVTSVYNIVDAYFVSQLGTQASGAVGIVFSLMAVIQAVGFTVGMGAGSTISRLLGKKETDRAQKTASGALFAAAVSGILLSVLGFCFLERLMLLMGATETILPYAKAYAWPIVCAAPVMTVSFLLNNLLRAEGRTGLSLVGIGAGSILNIGLDPLFIFVFRWGVWGAAAATAASQCIGCLILASFFLRKKTLLSFSVRNLPADVSLYREFLFNGIPSFFRQGLAGVAAAVQNHAAAGYGDAAVAAMSVSGKIFLMVYCILIGLGQGYQPAAGYNYGAGRYDRVREAYRFMMRLGAAAMTAAGVGLFLAAPVLIRQFAPGDPEAFRIGVSALRMQCAVMPLLPLATACNMTFQAVGQPVKAAFFAACRQGIFFLPLIFFLPGPFGIAAVEAAQPAADVLTFLACLPAMRRFLKKLALFTDT